MKESILSILIAVVVIFTGLNCSSDVTFNLFNDEAPPSTDGATLPMGCGEVSQAASGTPKVFFSSGETNIFEGFRLPDNSRGNGQAVDINICINQPLTASVILEFQVKDSEGAVRDNDYTLSSDDLLGNSTFLLLQAGQTEAKIKAAAIGDSLDNDVSSFIIMLVAETCEVNEAEEEITDCERPYKLKSPSRHKVNILDPEDIGVGFAQANSSLNEDAETSDMIMLSAEREAFADTSIRFEVTGGTAVVEEFGFPGAASVAGSPNQYEVTLPSGSSSASIPIDAFIDPDQADETVTLSLVDSSGYNPSGQTTHTTTIVSRPIVRFERVAAFGRGDLMAGTDYNPGKVILDPHGDVYIAFPSHYCVKRYEFTPGNTESESELMFKGNFVGINENSNLICDMPGSSFIMGGPGFSIGGGGGGVASITTAQIENRDYLFLSPSGTFTDGAQGVNYFLYNSTTREYRHQGSGAAPGGSNQIQGAHDDFAIDVANRKIYVAGGDYNNTEKRPRVAQLSFTVDTNDGGLNFTSSGTPLVSDLLTPFPSLQACTVANFVSIDCNTQSVTVNPHNQDIYYSLSRLRVTGSEEGNDSRRLYIARHMDDSTPATVDWNQERVFNNSGACGSGEDHLNGRVRQIAFADDGSIFIPDYRKLRVQAFTTDSSSNLNYLASIGRQPDELNPTSCGDSRSSDDELVPFTVTVDSERRLVYVIGEIREGGMECLP